MDLKGTRILVIGCPKEAAKDLSFTYQIELRERLQNLINWREQHGAE